jgi:hypothetical protein
MYCFFNLQILCIDTSKQKVGNVLLRTFCCYSEFGIYRLEYTLAIFFIIFVLIFMKIQQCMCLLHGNKLTKLQVSNNTVTHYYRIRISHFVLVSCIYRIIAVKQKSNDFGKAVHVYCRIVTCKVRNIHLQCFCSQQVV